MARIRTIKPEFFRHEALQDIEIANPGKYPMMVFAGLWGHCDSKGRFEWRPRQLKLDILPFIDFNMEETLLILEAGGMVRRYEVDGKFYGEVSTFEKHQRLSGKEATEGEKHPEPAKEYREATGKQQGSVMEIQESQEGKGREEEGKGVGRSSSPSLPGASPSALPTPIPSNSSRQGSRLSADWVLPKAWGEWALEEQPTWTADHCRHVAEKFRDHWIGQAGAKARKADWQATWRNWVRTEGAMKSSSLSQAPPVDAKRASGCCVCGDPWTKQILGSYYCQEHDQHSSLIGGRNEQRQA